jgi:hypothetical protein
MRAVLAHRENGALLSRAASHPAKDGTLICDECKLMLEAGFHTPYLYFIWISENRRP